MARYFTIGFLLKCDNSAVSMLMGWVLVRSGSNDLWHGLFRSMRQMCRTIILVVALCGWSIRAESQTVVLSDSFDGYPSGTFGGAYNFGDSGANLSSAIVAPGAGGSGEALQFSATNAFAFRGLS